MSLDHTDLISADELRQFDPLYVSAESPTSVSDYYSHIPDGTYSAVIEDARLTRTTSTNRPVLIWTLRITGPQAVNHVLHKNRVITDKTLGFLKEDLQKCGLDLDRISDLPSRVEELTGRTVSFEKRFKDGKMNLFFRWGPRPAADPAVADDGLPF